VYGGVSPLASKVVVKKLFTKTLLLGATSQTPPLQLRNWVC
jgi:hypothetical protein